MPRDPIFPLSRELGSKMARDIDDPANIARFLAMINGQPELPASETSFSSAGEVCTAMPTNFLGVSITNQH